MPDPARFMTEVLAMWTETDPGLRRAAIEAHFLDDVRFHDPDGEFTGHDALERFSDSLQKPLPRRALHAGEATAAARRRDPGILVLRAAR